MIKLEYAEVAGGQHRVCFAGHAQLAIIFTGVIFDGDGFHTQLFGNFC